MKIEMLAFGQYAANCYVVYDETTKDAIIIDPGSGGDEIGKWVQENGLKVKLIVLTHNHPDHIGALGEVKEATGANVADLESKLATFDAHLSKAKTQYEAAKTEFRAISTRDDAQQHWRRGHRFLKEAHGHLREAHSALIGLIADPRD